MNRNLAMTLAACRGRYIALLEGDDYWTDPRKLRKQADFLDRQPECSSCFHNVRIVREGGSEPDRLFHRKSPGVSFGLREVVSGHFIPTCSTMFRGGLHGEMPEWFYAMPMGDWPLHVMNAQHGRLGYLDEVMGCYRVHDAGAWSGHRREAILRKTIAAADAIDRYLAREFSKELGRLVDGFRLELARLHYADREYPEAREQLRLLLGSAPKAGSRYWEGVRLLLREEARRLKDARG
jgi:hypothetical protein